MPLGDQLEVLRIVSERLGAAGIPYMGMTDTTTSMDARQRAVLMDRSGSDRVQMAAAMFADARTLVEAGLRAEGLTDPIELRVAVCRRFYSGDLPATVIDAIGEAIRRAAGRPTASVPAPPTST